MVASIVAVVVEAMVAAVVAAKVVAMVAAIVVAMVAAVIAVLAASVVVVVLVAVVVSIFLWIRPLLAYSKRVYPSLFRRSMRFTFSLLYMLEVVIRPEDICFCVLFYTLNYKCLLLF